MHFELVNGIRTRYIVAGTGSQDVLFLHGWGASSRLWLRSMWQLRHDYRMWAIDLPGFGHSSAPPIDWYSIDTLTEHVAAFCQTVNLKPATVIGHSLGARITLDMARRHPELTPRLVTIAPSVTGRLGFNLDILMAGELGLALAKLSRWVWPIAALGAMSSYTTPKFIGDEAIKRTTSDWRQATWEATMGSLRAMVAQDFTPHLAEISQPVLVICGKQDYTLPVADALLAVERLPDARLVAFENLHHWPMDENRTATLTAIREFIQEASPEAVV